MSRIDEDFKENLLFSPGREQETGIPNLSIEEEMEELVPELRGGRVYGKRGKRATNAGNINNPFVNNLLRILMVLFAVSVLGFGTYIFFSSSAPKNYSKPAAEGISNPNAPKDTPPTSVGKNSSSTNDNTDTTSKIKTAHPMATYANIPLASGYMSQKYKWVSHSSVPDGTYIDFNWKEFMLNHAEYDNSTVLALKSDLVDPATGLELFFQDWKLSPDLSHILVATHTVDGWRHSNFADYYLFNIESKQLNHLNHSISDKFIPHEKGSGKISMTLFDPNGHNVAWVRDNDLFVTMGAMSEIRVTGDGSKNIINGIADWVYEEEVLAVHEATWFSDDGKNLAYLKFDDSEVKEYELQYFSKFGETSYPSLIDIKYPKPGTPNPNVALYIATLSEDGKSMPSHLIDFGADSFEMADRIVTQVNWVGNNAILVRMMNRVQDHQKLYLITRSKSSTSTPIPAGAWTVKLVRDEKSMDGAWIQHLQPLILIKPSPSRSSSSKSKTHDPESASSYSYIETTDLNKDFNTHLAFYESLDAEKPTRWLTSGQWEVTSVKGVDHDRGIIYFLSTEKGSMERHLYSVTLGGEKKLVSTTTLKDGTKRLVDQVAASLGERADAAYFNAQFSPACAYYVLAYLGPDVPWERLQKTANEEYGVSLTEWNNVRNTLSSFSLPRIKYLTIPNEAGSDINIKMIVPADFDDSGATKYPVLFQVYGGPNSQMVSMQYEVNYMSRIACLGVVSMIVDGRGTGFKGRKYRSVISTRLGEVEAIDQVTAARWAASQPFIDGKRIGIWGWSYGGYLTSKVIETNSGVFALGMAVAPVTDWKFYDTAYTERYMKTPQMNPDGYKKSAVAQMEGFKNSKFLLIHGTADDNVHFQNSAELVWHLTGAHVTSYTVQFYTDSDHSITANGAQGQVYEKLSTFMCNEFEMTSCTFSK